MNAIIPLVFAATLGNPIVVTQWQYYPVREQARGYLGRYPDQPLVVDSDLPEDADKNGIRQFPAWCDYNSMADINASYAEGKRYGLDGFAFFPARYRPLHWRAKDSSVKGMLTMPIVNFVRENAIDDDIKSIGKAVEYGCSAKHDGKTIVLSYWTDRFNKPEQLAKKLKLAHERLGDTFLYMVATSWGQGLWDWRASGTVYKHRMEQMKEHFRDMLRVADGIILDGTMSNHAVTNQTRVFAGGYHKLMTRTARAVVDEPEFKGKKLLGFTLSIGHQNGYHQSFTANAMGTRTLRESFEAVIAGDSRMGRIQRIHVLATHVVQRVFNEAPFPILRFRPAQASADRHGRGRYVRAEHHPFLSQVAFARRMALLRDGERAGRFAHG